MKHNQKYNNQGHALISLIFFAVISITISSAAIIIMATNSSSTSQLEQGTRAYSIAESGAENAILRLLRNPLYTGEELDETELGIVDASATIVVTGSDIKTITATGEINNFRRTVEVILEYVGGELIISSWKEVTL